jgi:glucosamine--fructose-6-phosphate aminotransferase (isomerizing)
MDKTEKSIFEQFEFWKSAPRPGAIAQPGIDYVVVGCGTSYNLAMSAAVALNENGFSAVAAPGNEWLLRPRSYRAAPQNAHVIAISRSGETTEVVQAASTSRSNGLPVTAITCDGASSLVANADQRFVAETHPDEGIVMTSSASLMLLLALRFAGIDTDSSAGTAQTLLAELNSYHGSYLKERTHFVFLGGGALYGVAAEGALKLQEMGLTATETYHPLEYRHGPISVADHRTLVVMLYHPDTHDQEEKLAAELVGFGAFVLGFGGPGTLSLEVGGPDKTRGLVCLPALQLLGLELARSRGLDTRAPRHLTKVVRTDSCAALTARAF